MVRTVPLNRPISRNMNSLRKACRVFALAALLASIAGVAPLFAQDQPSPPAKQQQSDHPSRRRGFAQQLTRETREAAGEDKDEKAQFRESPSVQLIARITGLSTTHAYFLSIFLNFAIIVALIAWGAGKFLPGAFRARTAAIQKAMQEAQKASEEARRRLAEIESRLKKLDVEIGMMRDSAEKEAAVEEARIQAAAREDTRKIVEGAQHEIAAAAKTARRELTAYAADLAVGLAQRQIHVDAATDKTLVRQFASELASAKAGNGKSGNGDGKDGR
jgi:F-type H+-transporting ATPase subunit b